MRSLLHASARLVLLSTCCHVPSLCRCKFVCDGEKGEGGGNRGASAHRPKNVQCSTSARLDGDGWCVLYPVYPYSSRYVESLIAREVASGIPCNRVAVAGSSQGGVLALIALRDSPTKLGAFVGEQTRHLAAGRNVAYVVIMAKDVSL